MIHRAIAVLAICALVVLTMASSGGAASSSSTPTLLSVENPKMPGWPVRGLDETDSLIFFENFESGAPNWQTIDLTAQATWHKDTFNAYGGSGMSWWVGDTLINGYDNVILQFLDSPTLNLSGATNPVFEFDAFWAVEDTTGGYPPGYDGWDGVNVWVSTNGGTSWNVLPVQSPVYTCTSLGSFGVVWEYGPNVAGWAGYSGGAEPGSWVHVTANMASYLSPAVKVRFALASDEQICTRTDSTLTGFFVDNLYLHDGATTYLQNNAEGLVVPSELIPGSGLGNAGQYWHIEEVSFPPAPTPTHVMRLSNVSGAYGPHWYDALMTPRIRLSQYSADSVTVQADFYVRGSLNVGDPGEWPNLDYWTVQVSPDEGANWYPYTIPWGQGGLEQYWIDANANYTPFSEMNAGELIDLTPYLGHDVFIRILFRSDGDTLAGEGLFVDNFWIDREPVVSVQDPVPVGPPARFVLGQNRPNPFNPITVIPYSLPQAGLVHLTVYNINGRQIATLVDGMKLAGEHQVPFDASNLASGIYLYRLETGDFTAAGKMVLMK